MDAEDWEPERVAPPGPKCYHCGSVETHEIGGKWFDAYCYECGSVFVSEWAELQVACADLRETLREETLPIFTRLLPPWWLVALLASSHVVGLMIRRALRDTNS